MQEPTDTPAAKAFRTGKWARTMTKWLITYSRRTGVKWQIVEFGGQTGAESTGIVDLIAIRKDHRSPLPPLKRGDRLDIVLIQTKGGGARRPSLNDVERLKLVAKHHRARAVVLATWRRSEQLTLELLRGSDWLPMTADEIFL